jgi:hypothetical protein
VMILTTAILDRSNFGLTSGDTESGTPPYFWKNERCPAFHARMIDFEAGPAETRPTVRQRPQHHIQRNGSLPVKRTAASNQSC